MINFKPIFAIECLLYRFFLNKTYLFHVMQQFNCFSTSNLIIALRIINLWLIKIEADSMIKFAIEIYELLMSLIYLCVVSHQLLYKKYNI